MKKLFIVGNGFDIHHGIQSKYSDFKKYLKNNNQEIVETIDGYFDNDYFWNDFEKSLGEFDADQLIDNCTTFLVSYGAEDWSDAYHHDYQYEIDKIVTKLSTGLKSELTDWVSSLEIPVISDCDDCRLSYLEQGAIFLNFNYTPSLEILYSIPETRINYIHGNVRSANSDLILGHACNPVSRNLMMNRDDLEDQDTRITEGNDIIDKYFEKTYKPTAKIIEDNQIFFSELNNIEEIYVLGHSMSEVDFPYFQNIVNAIDSKNVRWKISYYDNEELTRHSSTMNKLGICKSLIIFSELANL